MVIYGLSWSFLQVFLEFRILNKYSFCFSFSDLNQIIELLWFASIQHYSSFGVNHVNSLKSNISFVLFNNSNHLLCGSYLFQETKLQYFIDWKWTQKSSTDESTKPNIRFNVHLHKGSAIRHHNSKSDIQFKSWFSNNPLNHYWHDVANPYCLAIKFKLFKRMCKQYEDFYY